VKLGDLLKKLRPRSGEPRELDADALTSGVADTEADALDAAPAPTNWVPSQQDERPPH